MDDASFHIPAPLSRASCSASLRTNCRLIAFCDGRREAPNDKWASRSRARCEGGPESAFWGRAAVRLVQEGLARVRIQKLRQLWSSLERKVSFSFLSCFLSCSWLVQFPGQTRLS